MNIPENLFYTKDHEWVRVDNGLAFVGITEYAQDQLGDITYVELPDPGRIVEIGTDLAVVESVKAASDVFAPVSGVVDSINEDLDDSPEKINQSPYDEGWICSLKDFDSTELENLMSAEDYNNFLGE